VSFLDRIKSINTVDGNWVLAPGRVHNGWVQAKRVGGRFVVRRSGCDQRELPDGLVTPPIRDPTPDRQGVPRTPRATLFVDHYTRWGWNPSLLVGPFLGARASCPRLV